MGEADVARLRPAGRTGCFIASVTALRRLLDAAADPRRPSSATGKPVEKLKGDREGQWSIRINDQWRVCFVWSDGNAHDVEIADCRPHTVVICRASEQTGRNR